MTTHVGPVQVRFHSDHVAVLCPLGHLVTSSKLGRDFAGGFLEAKIGGHQHGSRPWIVTCEGATA